MQKNLVIVESPAKAKTIEKFLGKEFKVCSSYGHIRDLAKKGIGIDVANGFAPAYEVSADKTKLVAELKKMSQQAESVWLASDEDREGEAIAWHLTQVLDLPVEQTKRIVFHEITKQAILEAIESPRTVDMNLVNAQQARRVLDRLVGFELSPVLWKKVKPALSAGRVQSVAVKLIVEREREIIDFKGSEFYRITARFVAEDGKVFKAELDRKFDTKAEAVKFLESLAGVEFRVESVESKPAEKFPAAPFTTSTLQQEAGRKLSMSVAQTMSVAQKLYESGLITYMRTDSVNLSKQALYAAKEAVVGLYGEEYHNWRNYKTKSKGAQEAHEAIRPSYLDRQTIEGTPAEKRLYELIWKRTVASQMASAKIDKTIVSISISGHEERFVAVGEQLRFEGFMKLYSESVEEESEGESAVLPLVEIGTLLGNKDVVATQKFTPQPYRYSEALLVKKLEELGIGRPSTYAPTISTIINRGYVLKQNKDGVKRPYAQITLSKGKLTEKEHSEVVGKEKGKLAPTDIGMLVNDYLQEQFPDILDYNFTATVEKEFDLIAEGKEGWTEMIGEFYGDFHKTVEDALGAQIKQNNTVRQLGVDPSSGLPVSARIGRYGPMVQIGGEDGGKARFASLKKDQLIATITLEEALELFVLPRTLGAYKGEEVSVGIGKFGPYVRYGNKFVSMPKGDDPYTITLERANELIEQKEVKDKSAKEPIKRFDGVEDLVILSGIYGPYIQCAGKNYRIPKTKDPLTLTIDECRAIVAKSKK
ncbi:MAG: type I DNA topoisomerase [Tidjanibacter sp.]|nr:type I DNA topoisomerase [Tidjanibacter sp.]MBR3853606.1 type I DNA topoisomerase [Tidjanibacter sp.]